MFTHTLDINWSRGNDQVAQRLTLSGGREVNLSEVIPDESTNLVIPMVSLDVSALASMYIVSDKALTLKTNSSSEPDDTISLVAGRPLLWWPDSGITCPFTADVTALYITNASGAEALLQVYTLLDATP